MSRAKIYSLITAWTSPLLFILLAAQLLTGLGAIKGRELALVSLGIIDPASAGKLHTVWLVLLSGVVVYLHGIAGLGLLIARSKRLRRKTIWEAAVIAVGLALFVQFLVLYLI